MNAKRFSAIIVLFCLTGFALLSGQGKTTGVTGAAQLPAINPGLGSVPSQLLRSTPRATWDSFWQTGESGQFARAAHLLDLTEVQESQQRAVGAEVAEKLYRLMKKLKVRPNTWAGGTVGGSTPDAGSANVVVAFRFRREGASGEVWLRRTEDSKTGETAWLFTRQTVSMVPFWYRVIVKGEKVDTVQTLNAGLGPVPPGVHRQDPRETFQGFLNTARNGDFATAAHYLNLNHIPVAKQAKEGPRLARRLVLVLLRNVWIEPSGIANDEFGTPEKDLPETEELLTRVSVKGQSIPILLSRMYIEPMGTVWTFSPKTVDRIDFLYRAFGQSWFGDHLPAAFFSIQFAGLQLWQWTSLFLLLLLGWGIGRLLGHLVIRILRAIVSRTHVAWDDELVRAMDGPMGMVFWGLLVAVGSPWVGLSPSARNVTTIGWQLLTLLGVGWLLFRLVDSGADTIRRVIGERNPVGVSFLPIMSRFTKALVFVFILLGILSTFGVQVMGVMAGLGLGGVAVAFAAQKTIENLFGAVSIAGDRPFAVGDYVSIDDITGTVEDVGLRSIRVRTVERTLVTIPNATVMAAKVVNFQARDRFLFFPTIGLTYETTADQLTYILDELKKMLATDERIYPDAQRARFKEFGASSLNLEIFCWIQAPDYFAYTGVVEELNFRIMTIVEKAGASFAFPTQQLYLSRAGVPDPQKAVAAREEVQRRRADGTLAVPEPPPGLWERLRGDAGK
jgi:MscS family membrane protein